MSDPRIVAALGRVAAGDLQPGPVPGPPHPTDDAPEVRALAKALNGMGIGERDWHQNFRTLDQFYGPLAQAILNWQAGWVFDIEAHRWVQTVER